MRAGGLVLLVLFALFIAAAVYSARDATVDDKPAGPPKAAARAAVPQAYQDPAVAAYSPVTYGASPMLPVGATQAFTPPAPLTSPPKFTMLPFAEVHWQGLELIPLTATLARSLGIPSDVQGVIVDEATPPSDEAGFLAGDTITSIGRVATPDLNAFVKAADRVRDRRRVELGVVRQGQAFPLILWPLTNRLGNANGETAQTIPPGSVSPHAYQGRCTGCHRIGNKGQLPTDQGDLLAKIAPVIRANMVRPHRDRGICTKCHTILP